MTMCSAPAISVVMAVYNGERYLRQAIDSILTQTWTDFEFLIVNDGSTDQSRKIAASYGDARIRIIDNAENIGLTRSLNRALSLARGEFIARQDADDVAHQTRLEKQVQFLRKHPAVALLGGQAQTIDQYGHIQAGGKTHMPHEAAAIRWRLLFNNAFVHTSVMFRRDPVWTTLGGYDEAYPRTQDFELWSRVAAQYEVGNLPDVVVDYRKHTGSVTHGKQPLAHFITQNLTRFLGVEDAQTLAEWTDLIQSYRVADIQEPERLVDLMFTLFDLFCTRNPMPDIAETIRPQLADQLGLTAYHIGPNNRMLAARVLAQAVRVDAGILRRRIAGRVSLLKFLIQWSVGNFVRAAKAKRQQEGR